MLFVNPLQFGPSENYAGYPRSPDVDLAKCAELEVDLAFAPSAEEMYPRGYSTYVVEERSPRRCAGSRGPRIFRGVTTVLVKLFNMVRPHFWCFGQKEAQQAAVVRKMIADLRFRVEVVVVPTVREDGGLACDVRNRTMTANQRTEAIAVPASLKAGAGMAATGVRSADRIMAEVTHILSQHRRVRVIYVSIVDSTTMEAMREWCPAVRCWRSPRGSTKCG